MINTCYAVVTSFSHDDLALVALLDNRFADYEAVKRRMQGPFFSEEPQPKALAVSSRMIDNANGVAKRILKKGQRLKIEWDNETNRVIHAVIAADIFEKSSEHPYPEQNMNEPV